MGRRAGEAGINGGEGWRAERGKMTKGTGGDAFGAGGGGYVYWRQKGGLLDLVHRGSAKRRAGGWGGRAGRHWGGGGTAEYEGR